MYKLRAVKDPDGYTVAYDARGRGAYLVKATTENDGNQTKKRTGLVFCAEPPPDAAANLQANRQASGNVDALVALKAIEVSAKGGGTTNETASSEIADVATRTELVLLMRDAMYRICEMNANGVLSDERAEKIFGDVLLTARTLGQRDNVGKLIDVLAIVAKSPGTPEITADLVESLVSTIRIVVLGEQLMQKEGGADGLVTVLIVASIVSELGAVTDEAVKREIFEGLAEPIKTRRAEKAKLEAARKQKDTKESEKKKIDSKLKALDVEINELKAAAESLGIDPAKLQ